jgi:hypothetical protein
LNQDKTDRIKYLEKKVKSLEEEYSKDEEIKKMQAKVDKMQKELRRGFPLSEEQEKTIEAWKEAHLKEKHWDYQNDMPMNFGAIGGNFTYEFVPTSIGVIITCKCGCGEHTTIYDM